MTRYIPLSTLCNTVLFINPDAPLSDLHSVAYERLQAVKNLMLCLDGTRKPDPDEQDLSHIAHAASLLLRDSCDVLEVMEVRLMDKPAS
ncbi:hypothetical protein ACCD10_04810 [Pseudomonas sp. Pseusp122]|jgi:hypothetical protein|uniref:hypothetical protein n=1 Tax=unclassified Pseudomonas TaxID=196821 RepID=UPI0039A6BB8E